jgi:hypothetical protein
VRGALEVVWELGNIVSDRLIDLRLSEAFFGYLSSSLPFHPPSLLPAVSLPKVLSSGYVPQIL